MVVVILGAESLLFKQNMFTAGLSGEVSQRTIAYVFGFSESVTLNCGFNS